MQRALEMRHLRVYPQRVQIRKTLAAILARVAEVALVHTFHVRAVRPPADQHLSALGAGLWFGLARTARLFLMVHLPSVAREVVFVLQIRKYLNHVPEYLLPSFFYTAFFRLFFIDFLHNVKYNCQFCILQRWKSQRS
jgi:hypothetical protein